MRFILLCITILIFIGCGDDTCDIGMRLPSITNATVYDTDIVKINDYLDANNIVANSTASGLHYIIDEAGSEEKPEQCDLVQVAYTGYYLDETVFDSSFESQFPLTNVIAGWREGIPLFGKNGKGKLLVPSYLAYGDQPPSSIRPNAVMVFDIELKNF